MKQITMEDLIIHSMHNFGSHKIKVSILLVISREIFENFKVQYSATTKHIFETVYAKKNVFKLSKDGRFVELLYPEMLRECVKEKVIDNDVSNALAEYIQKINMPKTLENIENWFFETEIAGYLQIMYRSWLLNMLDRHGSFNSFDYHLALKAKDLEHIAMLNDLYMLVDVYCQGDLIPYENTECKSYVVKYVDDEGDDKYIELQQLVCDGIKYIKAIQRENASNAVDFWNVAEWQHSEDYEQRQKKFGKLQKQINDAKKHNLPYQSIKAYLDEIYGVN